MIESTLDLSLGEATLIGLALKQMQTKNMKQKDRDNLQLLEHKLTITYMGQKYRLMLVEEQGE